MAARPTSQILGVCSLLVLEAWERVRTQLPLTDEELRQLASNVAPYLR